MPLLPKRRLWRWFAILGVLLGTALFAAVLWAVYVSNSFSSRIAAIRAAGDPATISDLRPQPIPPAEDAAAQLAAVGPQIDAFAQEHGQFFKTPVGKAYDAREPGDPLTSEQLAAIRVILDRYLEIDAAISKAAACDQYASRLDYSLPHKRFLARFIDADVRTVHRFGGWQIETAIAAGRHVDATEQGIELLRLSRLMHNEPGLVGGLVAIAVHGAAAQATYDALTAGPVPEELHAALEQELARQDDLQPFLWMLKSERAIAISGIQDQFSGVRGLVANTVGIAIKMQYMSILDLFDAVLPSATEAWHVATSNPESALLKAPTGFGFLADQTQASLEAAYSAANRRLAVSRSLRVFNVLQQTAAERPEEMPSLSRLDLASDAKVDPFTGEPLLLKQTEQGWSVYSVGPDGNDDGGDLYGGKDFGVGPRKAGE